VYSEYPPLYSNILRRSLALEYYYHDTRVGGTLQYFHETYQTKAPQFQNSELTKHKIFKQLPPLCLLALSRFLAFVPFPSFHPRAGPYITKRTIDIYHPDALRKWTIQKLQTSRRRKNETTLLLSYSLTCHDTQFMVSIYSTYNSDTPVPPHQRAATLKLELGTRFRL
jgi:hypothetical protein